MWRSVILILGWTVTAITLYVGLVALELYWNLFDWLPRVDLKAIGLLLILLAALTAARWLAVHSVDKGSRFFSLVACLALIALGIYVFPPEQKSQGLFSRSTPSPLWYRGGRLIILCCPGFFWVFTRLRPARKGSPESGF